MHLIVVRRDLRRFQHLHPAQDATGAWSTPVTLPDAGVYHAFADFRTDGERHTPGVDLFAGGRFEPLALPPPSNVAATDGYDVALRDDGSPSCASASASAASCAATCSPTSAPAATSSSCARAISRTSTSIRSTPTTWPSSPTTSPPGRYRLFLQFRHADRVHTAAFTKTVTP